jgi:hypothetical protein
LKRAAGSVRLRLGVALSVAVVVVLVSGASAAGPGGWDHLSDGGAGGTSSLNGAVYALNADRPNVLYVGGTFTGAGGVPGADRIASWNGIAWAAVSSPSSQISNGAVNAIAYDAVTGHVFAGGTFTNAGGNPNADFLAVWDGTSWAPFCAAIPATVNALQIIGRKLYVAGAFGAVAGVPFSDRLLRCDLDTGVASSTAADSAHAFSGTGIYALTADSNGSLYAGGGFTDLGGDPAADNVVYLDAGGWHAMGSGSGSCSCAVNGFVRSLTAIGTDVYIGTDAKDVAGIAQADNVARWNGSAWSALGSNTSGTDGWFPASAFIYGMTNDGTNVYATGSFQNANGDPTADAIASFDGSAWHALGSDGAGNGPWIGNGLALAVFGQHLYAGGNFTSAGGDPQASYVARYVPLLAPPPPPPPILLPTPPTVTITSPAANTFFNHPEQLLVSGTVTAPGGLARFCVAANTPAMPPAAQCDETAQVRADGSFSDVSVSANVIEGSNTITAYALDRSGQERDASVVVDLPLGVDLRATSIEVTQGIQRFGLPLNLGVPVPYSGVTLVQGATTVVRAYANAFATGRAPGLPIPNVPALLEGTRNGAPLPGSPLSPDSGPATLSAGSLVVDLREIADPNSGYTYTLPLSWTEGGPIQLRSDVNPQTSASAVPEANTANNHFTLTGVAFHHHDPIVISPVEMVYRDPDTHKMVVPPGPSAVFERASMVTPLGDGELIVFPYRGTIDLTAMYNQTEGTPTQDTDRYNATFTAVATWEDNHNEDGLTFGVVADPDARGRENPVAFGGCVFCATPSVARIEPIAFVNSTRPLTSVTHELWHTQNYFHAGHHCAGGKPTDYPYVDWPPDDQGFIQGMGLDRRPGSGGRPGTYRRLIAGALANPPLAGQLPQYYDVMSYCNYGQEDPTWVSARSWDGWGSLLPLGAPALSSRDVSSAAVQGTTLQVMASVNSDGTGEITQVLPQVKGTAPTADDAASPYRIVVRDAAGAVVSSTGVAAQSTHVDYSAGHIGADIEAEVRADGANRIELTNNGHVVATRTRPARPPTVKLLSPRPGSRIGSTGNVTIRWKADDSNGDPLEVMLLYSADGGRSFHNLALGVFSGQTTTVPAALFSKTTNGRIRIAVNDGFDEVSASSGRLSSAGAPPVVQILRPTTAERVRADAMLALFGEAFDDSGKLITAAQRLTWFDGRHQVGRGRSLTLTGLTPGAHRLTLRARGANGLVGLASVAVKVLGVKPDLMITAAPRSVRRTARTVTLHVASTVPGVLRVGGRSFPVGRTPRSVKIPIKPGRKPLTLRLVVRGGGGHALYTLKLNRK